MLITFPVAGAVSGVATAVAVLLGTVRFVTAAAGYCPLYAWVGIRQRL